MKSRIAILGLLVSGMLFSTAGAGLAIQGGGSAQSGTNAAVAQYETPTPTPTPPPECTPMPTDNKTSPAGTCATPTPTPVCTATPTDQKNGAVGPSDTCGEGGGVLPAEANNAPTTATKPATNSGSGVLPAEETTTPETQPTRQAAAAAQTSQLPFTGFAAIPVLLGGLALLSGGLVLRRRTRSE